MSKECEKRRCKLCKKLLICEKWLCKRCYLDAKNKFYFIAGTVVGVGAAACLSVFSKNADDNKNKNSSNCDNSNED